MRKRGFLITFFIIVLVGFLICFSILQKITISPMDTVSVNEILKQTEQNWNRLSDTSYSSTTYNFTVIDLIGTVLYSTANTFPVSYSEQINRSIANRDSLVDIIVDGTLVGKLIIENDLSSRLTNQQDLIEKSILFIFLFLAILMLAYFFYLHKKIFKPFHNLRRFASSIASGNLDTPIVMDKNNVFGAFTESFDLMREALKAAKNNEYLANKSKKELVASLSHDIKNPVASIKAICETIALTSNDRHIITIHQKAEQIDRLISDMFQSTLEELGALKVNCEEYNSTILLDIIENINYYHKIHITSNLPECIILCDKLRLTQVFDNLLGNSYKYAGTDIHISFHLDIDNLQIRIKDFGKGIQEDELSLVYEKFYRGKNSDGKDGSGLGLYLSKLFTEKMGGQLECINETNGFLVKLDLRLAGIQFDYANTVTII